MKSNSKQNSYTAADINRYLNGGMTAAEMHDMERAALQDPFLADAIEGYREADATQTEKHLNEITALLQNYKQAADVIVMPKRRKYSWQIAVSVIAVIGIGIFLLSKQMNIQNSSSLAENKVHVTEEKDSVKSNNYSPSYPRSQDSSLTAMSELHYSKRSNNSFSKRKKLSDVKDTRNHDVTASARASAPTAKEQKQFTTNDSDDLKKALATNGRPVLAEPNNQNNTTEAVAGYMTRKLKVGTGNTWTTDKGKPFVLSEVEEINVGRTTKKVTDTSVIKPEGGWTSFQTYLFSKLSRKDTTNFVSSNAFNSNLELEFSLTEDGLPYNIKVLGTQDSTTAKTAADALQQGPKWITADKKQKRLNIRY